MKCGVNESAFGFSLLLCNSMFDDVSLLISFSFCFVLSFGLNSFACGFSRLFESVLEEDFDGVKESDTIFETTKICIYKIAISTAYMYIIIIIKFLLTVYLRSESFLHFCFSNYQIFSARCCLARVVPLLFLSLLLKPGPNSQYYPRLVMVSDS